MSIKNNTPVRGFTMIELMVVISIIGLLSSVIISSVSVSRDKANVAQRLSSAKEVEKALEVYYSNTGSYPNTSGSWSSLCSTWGGDTNWIPGLTPTYLARLPRDPDTNGSNACCYMYRSNGTDFKLTIAYQCATKINTATYGSFSRFIDPARDGGSNSSLQDWNGVSALSGWAIYTRGGAAW